MQQKTKKIIAILLAIMILYSAVGTVVSLAIENLLTDSEIENQNIATNNKNVEVDILYEDGTHTKKLGLASTDTKIKLKVNVRNTGYLENMTVDFSDANFKISGDVTQEGVQKIDETNNKIVLGKIVAGKSNIVELTIIPTVAEEVNLSMFNQDNKIKVTGTYIDADGEENAISKICILHTEWEQAIESNLSLEITKYIPYEIEGKKGVLVETTIKTNIKDNSLPIKTTHIEYAVPKLVNTLPTQTVVIAKQTAATNGRIDGEKFTQTENWNYNSQEGKVTIDVSNAEQNGKIQWKKDSLDEYRVINIYSSDVYDLVKDNLESIEINGKVEHTVYSNMLEKRSTKTATITTNVAEQLGNLLDVETNIVQTKINKGYMYNKTNETLYTEEYTLYIPNVEIVDELNIIQNSNELYTESETISAANNIYNKTIKVNLEQMKKILGADGYIDIYSNDVKIGTLQATLQDGDIKPDAQGNVSLDISANNTSKITIKTSRPQTSGYLKVIVDKAVNKNTTYTNQEIKDFIKMATKVYAQAVNNKTIIQANEKDDEVTLEEPTAKATLSISNDNLSTVVTNSNVEIRAVLETDSIDDILYTDPTIKIRLPSYIETISNIKCDILQAGELTIESSLLNEADVSKVIEIKLNGTQTKYDDNITKGTTITINADITVNKLTPAKTDVIEMEYQNNNELQELIEGVSTKTEQIQVNFVAPAGVVTVSELSGHSSSGEKILAVEEQERTATLDIYSQEKIATYKGTIINNYGNNISDVNVLGRIPSVNTNNTFNPTLQGPITVSNSNIVVYYSTNEEATNDISDLTNAWTTTIEDYSTVKSYLLVLQDKMAGLTQIEFNMPVKIPANLTYNNQCQLTYTVKYNNESSVGTFSEIKEATVITISTGTGPVIQATLSADVEENSIVRECQYIKFNLNVKNTGTVDATNVNANVTMPGGLQIIDYDSICQDFANEHKTQSFNIGTLKAGESINESYYAIVKLSDKNLTEETVSSVAQITADTLGTLESNRFNLTVKPGSFSIINRTVEIADVINKDAEIKYQMSIFNVTENTLNNVIVEIPLPQGATLEQISSQETDSYEIDSNNKIIMNIGNLEKDAGRIIALQYKLGNENIGEISTRVSVKADGVEKHYSNERIIKISEASLTIESKEQESQYVKEGKEFTYTYILKTLGEKDINEINITDNLPQELELVDTKLLIQDKNGEEYYATFSISNDASNNNVGVNINKVKAGSTITIQITVIPHLQSEAEDEKEISNYITVNYDGVEVKSEPIVNYIEYVSTEHGEDEPVDGKYKITGVAWIDRNKDGKRSDDEELVKDVQVILMNKLDGSIVLDKDTNQEKITVTDDQGKYSFDNLDKGTYLVVFLYDSDKYVLTDYRKEGVASSTNSDVISTNIVYNGQERQAGITDTIIITDSHIRNIDIGLCTPEKFDLSLDKYINKVIVTTSSKGTQTYEYGDKKIAKVEIPAKDVDASSIVVEYKIVVTNKGDVTGYVRKIVDYLPEDMKFSSEINKDWYQSTNGNVYNTSLANEEIKPGESKEVTLTLTKKLTNDAMGKVISNDAEIYECYNDYGLVDVNSTPANKNTSENDFSTANIAISVKTGEIFINISLIVIVISILGIGIYEINKRVLKKDM